MAVAKMGRDQQRALLFDPRGEHLPRGDSGEEVVAATHMQFGAMDLGRMVECIAAETGALALARQE
jgi:hypothetical protein